MRLGVREVFLALDADIAGREAAVKIGDLFQSQGVAVRVAALPAGSDPDAYLMERGPEAFKLLLKDAPEYLKFLVEHRSKEFPLQTPAGKSQLVRAVTKQVRQWDNPLMVHESLRKLAKLVDVPEEVIGVGRQEAPNLYVRRQDTLGNLKEEVDPDEIMETDLLRWLLLVGEEKPELADLIRANIHSDELCTERCRALLNAYYAAMEEHGERDLLSLTMRCGTVDIQNLIDAIMGKSVNEDRADDEVEGTILRLKERNWMRRRESVREQMSRPDLSDDEELELVKQFEAIRREEPKLTRPDQLSTARQ